MTTRLLFTNLHPGIKADHLREHIGKCLDSSSVLTDLKVLFRPDGTSRRMAFAGFKDSKDAQKVLDWADGTWVQCREGGTNVRVEWAKNTKEISKPERKRKTEEPQAPSKPSKMNRKAVSDSQHQATLAKDLSQNETDKFAAFLSAVKKKKVVSYVDDQAGATSVAGVTGEASHQGVTSEASHQGETEADDEGVKGPETSKHKGSISKDTPADPASSHVVPTPLPDVEDDGIAKDEEISDMDYMAKRMRRTLGEGLEEDTKQGGETDKTWDQDEVDGGAPDAPSSPSPPSPLSPSAPPRRSRREMAHDQAIELITQSRRLFLRNLAYTATDDELRDIFSPFGTLADLHVVFDTKTHTSKGIAYVTFVEAEAAVKAFEELDQTFFQGRLLHVLPAVDRRTLEDHERNPATVKARKLEEKKKMSDRGLNWATLYMNSDAVLSLVADRLRLPKSEILDATSSSAAVRQAIAETQIIDETKKYFAENGVDLEKLAAQRTPRSPTAILVKNIPYNTSEGALRALFEEHGEITRFLFPPIGTIAIVEMKTPADAASAWKGLMYRKMGNSILYLEKAPAGLFSGVGGGRGVAPGAGAGAGAVAGSGPVVTSTADGPAVTPTAAGAAVDAKGEPGSTLYIKNLSFTTTDATLRACFAHFPELLFARVRTKPDPLHRGQTKSMGFGFVGFKTAKAAQVALDGRQGYLLEGHSLDIKFAQRGRDEEETDASPSKSHSTSTKLIAKNVPFEVSRQDIRELFSAYGQLKSVRLPKRVDHRTRGFAFLEFVTHREAEAAMEALKHTHLLGRHIVLEWAKDTEDVETLRRKTAEDQGTANMRNRRVKRGVIEALAGPGGEGGDE